MHWSYGSLLIPRPYHFQNCDSADPITFSANDIYPGQSTAMKSGWLNLIPSTVNWTECVGNEATLTGASELRSLLKYGENNVKWNKPVKVQFKKLHPLKSPRGTYTPENCQEQGNAVSKCCPFEIRNYSGITTRILEEKMSHSTMMQQDWMFFTSRSESL